MTDRKNFKRLVRERMTRTGERYTDAKRAIEREMHAVTCDLDEDCTCDPVVVSVDPVTTRVRGD